MLSQALFMGLWGILSQKIFKIRILPLARNEFHGTKFPELFWNFVANSLLMFLGKCPNFQRSVSNTLTFLGFPDQ